MKLILYNKTTQTFSLANFSKAASILQKDRETVAKYVYDSLPRATEIGEFIIGILPKK